MLSRSRAAVLALVVGLLLAACGQPGDDGDHPTGPTSSATGAGTASPSPASPSPATSDDPEPGPSSGAAAEPPPPGTTGTLTVDGRPFELTVPPGYDPDDPAPLVVALHGFGDTLAAFDERLGLREEARRRGALYALPEGTPDASGKLFWDAADACCGWDGPDVDDSGHLAALVSAVSDSYAVDPGRVALVGHSNGGFMAYRAACDHADLVRVVVSVAGAMPADDSGCEPSRPVDVVQVHGTADPVVRLDGGRLFRAGYASAADTVGSWARFDGCGAAPDDAGSLDLDVALPGSETSVASFTGCADGARVELWTVEGAGHSPTFGDGFATAVLDAVVGAGGPSASR